MLLGTLSSFSGNALSEYSPFVFAMKQEKSVFPARHSRSVDWGSCATRRYLLSARGFIWVLVMGCGFYIYYYCCY